MKYDFDQIHSRQNTNCTKWDAVKTIFGSQDMIPMWVADMDFPAARPIVEVLEIRARHEFYGYTQPGSGLIEAVVERLKKKFGWQIEAEWVVFTSGVIPAINIAVRSLTRPGDEIILHDARHTHASLMLKQGVHPKIVQERLGHTSIQITLDTYSHVAPGLQQAAANRFDDIVIPKEKDDLEKALKEIVG